MDFYGVHPPSEVHIPGATTRTPRRRKEQRSRSPSPLSLRDPQDYGDYDQHESSDDEGGSTKAQQERPSRPLPLSLAATALDLPTLAHARNGESPRETSGGSSRRYRSWSTLTTPEKSTNDESLLASSSPTTSPKTSAVTTTPLRATPNEAPFDESSGPRRAAVVANMTPPQRTITPANQTTTTEEASPFSVTLSSTRGTVAIDVLADEEEPPACELQEPPSLRTFRRPLSSAVPPVTSPPPPPPSDEPAKMLPFEDECEDDGHEVEEKKTNDPGPIVVAARAKQQQRRAPVSGNAPTAKRHPQPPLDEKQQEAGGPLRRRSASTGRNFTKVVEGDENSSKKRFGGSSKAVEHARSLLSESTEPFGWQRRNDTTKAGGRQPIQHRSNSLPTNHQPSKRPSDAGLIQPLSSSLTSSTSDTTSLGSHHERIHSLASAPPGQSSERSVRTVPILMATQPPVSALSQNSARKADEAEPKKLMPSSDLPLQAASGGRPQLEPRGAHTSASQGPPAEPTTSSSSSLQMSQSGRGTEPSPTKSTRSKLEPRGIVSTLSASEGPVSRQKAGNRVTTTIPRQRSDSESPKEKKFSASVPPRSPCPSSTESKVETTAGATAPSVLTGQPRVDQGEERMGRLLDSSLRDDTKNRPRRRSNEGGEIPRLAPSPRDSVKRNLHDASSVSDVASVASVASIPPDKPSSSSLTATSHQTMSPQQKARERIKSRIRSNLSFDSSDHGSPSRGGIDASQSFDHGSGSLQNPIEMRRSTSFDAHRTATTDFDRSISSLPETRIDASGTFSPQKPRSLYGAGTNANQSPEEDSLRRQHRLEMSQAEYMAMRARQSSPEKESSSAPIDEVPLIPLNGGPDLPRSDAPGKESGTGDDLSPPRLKTLQTAAKALDPPLASKLAPESQGEKESNAVVQPQVFRKAASFDGRQLHSLPEEGEEASLPYALQKPDPMEGPQFHTPSDRYEAPEASANHTSQSMQTADPPSLRRFQDGDKKEAFNTPAVAVPATPQVKTEEPPSLTRPRAQELTPRRSNASPSIIRTGADAVGSSSPANESTVVSQTKQADIESLGSADTHALITSLDDLVKDLEGMASKRSIQEQSYSPAIDDGQQSTQFFKPLLVQSINNDLGIPKGDIMLSLLNENTERTWASRVTESIWRCRTMRQNCDTKWLRQKLERKIGAPSRGRTSVAIDVDDNEIIGGIENVEETQKSALEHLKYDDFEDALELYEKIAGCYYRYFEGVIRSSNNLPHMVLLERLAYFKAFIGACLHNIGVIHLLRGEYLEAYTCFDRATNKRGECHGIGTTDHLVRDTLFVSKVVSSLEGFSYRRCFLFAGFLRKESNLSALSK